MLHFFRKSIRNKMLLTTGLGTVVVIAAALFAIATAWQSIKSYQSLLETDVNNERRVLQMGALLDGQLKNWNEMLLLGADPSGPEYRDHFFAGQQRLQETAAALLQDLRRASSRTLLEQFIAAHAKMGAGYREGVQMFDDSGYNQLAAQAVVYGLSDEPHRLMAELQTSIATETAEAADASGERAARGLALALGSMAVAVIAAFAAFLWLLQRNVIRPAQELETDLARLAAGDFSLSVRRSTEDELGRVAASGQKIQKDLGRLIASVGEAVRRLGSAAEQMAAVADRSHHDAREQQAQTGQVAAAMNEMSSTVHEVARNAAEAASAAQRAAQQAGDGQQVVEETVRFIGRLANEVASAAQAITDLDQESTAIGGVLDVIRGIAEQTNLLALNAAIEAARAGDQGRGFSVVADEVRSLASRTQQSIREIQSNIERLQSGSRHSVQVIAGSRAYSEQAVEQARLAGTALLSINSAIAAINDMNTQIAGAAEEQGAVTEEMNRSLVGISRSADNGAESSAANKQASAELAEVAAQLTSLTAAFRTR